MSDIVLELHTDLKNVQNVICKGYTSTEASGIEWLETFCKDFLKFCNKLHKFLLYDCPTRDENIKDNIFLCLTQVLTCVRNLERTIKAEIAGGIVLSASRQHFLDRVLWCFAKLKSSISLANSDAPLAIEEEANFVDVMDRALDCIANYSEFKVLAISNVAEFNAEAMFDSKKIRSAVDSIISQTLAFANVALQKDKKALSALCQKVLRECMAFQEECSLTQLNINTNNRTLQATLLESALYQLEDYINESLLRLVFRTFLNYSKYSVDHLRYLLKSECNETMLDENIADFDVNSDRTTQIGIFAIAFAPNVKVKTNLRSCLASLESLDSCLIPSLQSNSDLHSEILGDHFTEEIDQFKVAIQEIIDSNAFCTCYLEILNECIVDMEKKLVKDSLNDVLMMGNILIDHFKLNSQNLGMDVDKEKSDNYDSFVLILQECQAIFACADQVDEKRIVKRLKILRSILSRLKNSLSESPKKSKNEQEVVFIMSDDLDETYKMFESFGISPSIRSILYKSNRVERSVTDSLKGNSSNLLPLSPMKENLQSQIKKKNVQRKESLRTAMFKRQKSNETEQIYKTFKEDSNSLQITDILDQLTGLSSKFSNEGGTNYSTLSSSSA